MSKIHIISLFIGFLIHSGQAYAYLGPGAGLSAIGSVLALLGFVFLLIVGFLWYPIKRLFKKKDKDSEE